MTITFRALRQGDLDAVFRWESNLAAARMAAFTRADPTDRAAFDLHYEKVLANSDNTNLAIDDDSVFVGTIASFTVEGQRELTYWVDPDRWGQGIASAAVATFLERETLDPFLREQLRRMWARTPCCCATGSSRSAKIQAGQTALLRMCAKTSIGWTHYQAELPSERKPNGGASSRTTPSSAAGPTGVRRQRPC
jgi:hypothetical protein